MIEIITDVHNLEGTCYIEILPDIYIKGNAGILLLFISQKRTLAICCPSSRSVVKNLIITHSMKLI